MKIAVEGCAHGELDTIYEALAHLESINKIKVDMLIICGDFQSVRNQKDLACMACPQKYRKLNTFYKYHSGEKIAPVLTLFIGGNHEASNYLSELFYGGWVCPNIYYMGRAGVVRVNGLRIAGLSGIYKGGDYLKGHFERYPFSEDTKRSVYHIRNLEVFRLKQLKEPIDIVLSHDWPKGVYNYGNKNALLQRKGFLREEVESNTLGSRPAEDLLKELKPSYWFAAHLHCKFAAVVPHSEPDDSNKDWKKTRFLALDKCLPRRRFLQILDIGPSLPEGMNPVLEHDPEWLAVLSSTNHLLSLSRNSQFMPGPGSKERSEFTPTEVEKREVCSRLDSLVISPELFKKTAESHGSQGEGPFPLLNPQTLRLCKALGLTDPMNDRSTGSTPVDSLCEDMSGNQASDSEGDSSDDMDSVGENNNEEDRGSSVEGLFIIDRRKSNDSSKSKHKNISESMRRSKLVLSSPLNSTDYNSELSVSSVSETSSFIDQDSRNREEPENASCHSSFLSLKNLQGKISFDGDEQTEDLEAVKRLSDDSFESNTVPPTKRVMKRRNLNLYSTSNADSE